MLTLASELQNSKRKPKPGLHLELSIICRWRTRATRCTTANVLQTKVDAQCDKLATELSRQHFRRSTFSSYSELFAQSRHC